MNVSSFSYADGLYSGESNGDIPNGQGKINWVNGDWYDGEWVEGRISGYGSLFRNTGEEKSWTYTGDFLDGKRHGKGKLVWSNGDYYDGEWKNGRYSGYGTQYVKNKEGFFETYEGFFLNGKRNGKGKLTSEDGTCYEGEWAADAFEENNKTAAEDKKPDAPKQTAAETETKDTPLVKKETETSVIPQTIVNVKNETIPQNNIFINNEDIPQNNFHQVNDIQSVKYKSIILVAGIVALVIFIGLASIVLARNIGNMIGRKSPQLPASAQETPAPTQYPVSTIAPNNKTEPSNDDIVMPNLLGMSENQALQYINDLGLIPVLAGYEVSGMFDAGTVMIQEIDPGSSLKTGDYIYYVLSVGLPEPENQETFIPTDIPADEPAVETTPTPTPTLTPESTPTHAPSATPVPFVPVSSITGLQTTIEAGAVYSLSTAAVNPFNATNKNITWEIIDDIFYYDGIAEKIEIYFYPGSFIAYPTYEGLTYGSPRIVLRATITNGMNNGIDYIQDFIIYVESSQNTYNW